MQNVMTVQVSKAIGGKVAGGLEERLAHLEKALEANLGQRVDAVESVVSERLASSLGTATKGYSQVSERAAAAAARRSSASRAKERGSDAKKEDATRRGGARVARASGGGA